MIELWSLTRDFFFYPHTVLQTFTTFATNQEMAMRLLDKETRKNFTSPLHHAWNIWKKFSTSDPMAGIVKWWPTKCDSSRTESQLTKDNCWERCCFSMCCNWRALSHNHFVAPVFLARKIKVISNVSNLCGSKRPRMIQLRRRQRRDHQHPLGNISFDSRCTDLASYLGAIWVLQQANLKATYLLCDLTFMFYISSDFAYYRLSNQAIAGRPGAWQGQKQV